MEIKSILFPTDFSEGSAQALEYAIDLTNRYGAKLTVIHVIYDVVRATGWYVPHTSVEEMYKDLEKSAQKELDSFGIKEMGALKNVERVVLKGVPHEEIIKYATQQKMDMIIMGTHGRKGLDRVLFGSTASQVVRFAPCPVLSVRLPQY